MDLAAVAQGELPGREFAVARYGVRSRKYKLLLMQGGDPLLRDLTLAIDGHDVRLFDLELDPLERVDVRKELPSEADALLRVYREALHAGFQRFETADNHEPPPTPFAIGSVHFRKSAQPLVVAANARRKAITEAGAPGDWLESMHWQRHWLMAREAAPPITVRFPVPDGDYEISAHVRGHGSISLMGGDEVPVRAPPHKGGRVMKTDGVALGRTTVEGEMFYATLHPPEDGTWFWIKLFGFRPLAVDAVQTREEEKAHTERLRALGYVE